MRPSPPEADKPRCGRTLKPRTNSTAQQQCTKCNVAHVQSVCVYIYVYVNINIIYICIYVCVGFFTALDSLPRHGAAVLYPTPSQVLAFSLSVHVSVLDMTFFE